MIQSFTLRNISRFEFVSDTSDYKVMSYVNENGKQKFGSELDIDKSKFKESSYGYRHQQCFVMFICLAVAYSMRSCIGVAIVGMVARHHNDTSAYHSFVNDETPDFNNTAVIANQYAIENDTIDIGIHNVTNPEYLTTHDGILHKMLLIPPYPEFTWSKKTQDIVITSFFWGYMSLQIPAGQLVHRFGPKVLLVGAMTINCVVSFVFPWAVFYGGYLLGCLCRLLQGMSQACIVPGLFGFFGRWAPLQERSRLVGFVLGGQAIGTVLGLPITGYVAASPLGWPGIFRFYGLLSGLVALLVYFTIYDTPAMHPKISKAEKQYIDEGLGLKPGHAEKQLPVPWKKILTFPALYGIVISHVSQTWGQTILFAEIPSFMDKIMGVDIKSNGVLTALPFLVMWFSNFFFIWLTDWIIIKNYMTVTHARKFANSLGNIPAAIGLIVLAYAPKTLIVVESILIIICTFKIAAHAGAMTTHIDITPNFASTTMSISNFVSNFIGSQAPLVTGFLLDDVSSERDWRKVFFVTAGFYFFCNIVYLILGTAEKAPWNDPPTDADEEAPEKEPMMSKDEIIRNGERRMSEVMMT